MYNPTMRLLAILDLLQSRGEVSGQELAQALEVEERSIRRYIMMLRDSGIPIEGERGRHGGYSLRPGFRMPPMMFNTEEITAVMMGLMLMRDLGATSPVAIETATTKIERVLPEALYNTSQALRQSLVLDRVDLGTYGASSEQIIAISVAAHERKYLSIGYQAADGTQTERLIAPYGLVLHGRKWYIPAYCALREDMRVFRMDRVVSISTTHEAFTRPDDFDASTFVLISLAQMSGLFEFEVILHVPLRTAQEYIPSGIAILEPEGSETLLRCYADDAHWLAQALVHSELPFTVRQNDDLRAALQMLADDILKSIRQS